MPSPAGWREVPCIECGRFVEGINFAERCAECQGRRARRAQHLASRSALIAAALAAAWTIHVLPLSGTGRWYAGIAIAATYLLVWAIVRRIAMEVLP